MGFLVLLEELLSPEDSLPLKFTSLCLIHRRADFLSLRLR